MDGAPPPLPQPAPAPTISRCHVRSSNNRGRQPTGLRRLCSDHTYGRIEARVRVKDLPSHESKKKDRAGFICPQWTELVSRHYASDIEAARALKADPKVLSKLRSGTPVVKSTILKMLRRYESQHGVGSSTADRVVDTRSRRPLTERTAEPSIARFNS
jgi:hypothetical protein